jgi:immune inhibitor A
MANAISDDPLAAQSLPAPRDPVALAEALHGLGDIAPTVADAPRDLAVGDTALFWLIDRQSEQHYQSNFSLRYAGTVALVYVEDGVEVDQAALERNARMFEDEIYGRNQALFGVEWSPGVDGDERLTILLANLPGVGGYFSSSDSLPQAVNRFSNEREMFYINVGERPGPNLDLRNVLAHEFQHMIHWNQQRNSPTWFNEGLATLAEDLVGEVRQGLPQAYLREPDLALFDWTYRPPSGPAHYGGAQLLMRYLHEQYAGDAALAGLIAADAGRDTAQFVRLAQQRRPEIDSFAHLVGDWAVANLLNDPSVADGRYAYSLLPGTVTPLEIGVGAGTGEARQWGVDYLRLPPGPLTLRFDGGDTARLVAAETSGARAYWSNAADNSVATLTRAVDLRNVASAQLDFDAWYEIEGGYDYAFVTASTDGGATWATLPGTSTTRDDPQGANYGDGYTGVSGTPQALPGDGARGVWLREQVDLTPYAGREILLRFWYITDDAEHRGGLLLDNLRIDAIGYADDAESGDSGWQAQGFLRTGTALAQPWELRLVRWSNGSTVVERLAPDAQGVVTATVAASEQAVLVVLPTSPLAHEPSSYTYDVTR